MRPIHTRVCVAPAVCAGLLALSACRPPRPTAAPRDCVPFHRTSPAIRYAPSWRVAATGAHDAGPPPPLRLHGDVYDDSSGRPLSGALVFLAGTHWGTVTDSLGRFALVGTDSPAVHRVVVRRLGFASREDRVALPLPAGQMLRVRLAPRPAVLDHPCGGGLPHVPVNRPGFAGDPVHWVLRPPLA